MRVVDTVIDAIVAIIEWLLMTLSARWLFDDFGAAGDKIVFHTQTTTFEVSRCQIYRHDRFIHYRSNWCGTLTRIKCHLLRLAFRRWMQFLSRLRGDWATECASRSCTKVWICICLFGARCRSLWLGRWRCRSRISWLSLLWLALSRLFDGDCCTELLLLDFELLCRHALAVRGCLTILASFIAGIQSHGLVKGYFR